MVENNHARGICLSDGSEYKADIIISAADGRSTIFSLLGGRYADKTMRQYYDEMPVFDPLVHVALGVGSDMSDVSKYPQHLVFKTKSPVQIGDITFNTVGCTNYSFDPTLAPSGKTLLVSMFPTDYQYWKQLSNNLYRYKAEKQRIAKETIAALESRFHGISDKVEVIDVATPLTFERYSGNYHGAYEGWLPTTKNYGKTLNNTLPGLCSFYHIGQWTVPGGGVPIAIITGRQVIQAICKQEKKAFITTHR
jgi:phytoene dehydrogenase-like protein